VELLTNVWFDGWGALQTYGRITPCCTLRLDLITGIGQSESQQNRELLPLRQHLGMLQRTRQRDYLI
jgi:hypothetical protein